VEDEDHGIAFEERVDGVVGVGEECDV